MHIDEDTHLNQRTEARRQWYVPLEKTYRRLCRVAQLSRTGPQEPRRPRFPFFHLHNVKELTPGATFVIGVGGGQASEFFRTEPHLPVARQ